MGLLDVLLALLDSRSFGSIWFWIMLALVWTLAGRSVLGVPPDVFRRVAQASDQTDVLILLDWLSLVLPRWRLGQREGVFLTAAATCILSALVVLGFVYGLEMAQALVFLALPVLLVNLTSIRLAARLRPLLAKAHQGLIAPDRAAVEAARQMRRQRLMISLASVLVVVATAFYGAIWIATHPFGL